jgi:hypothetical protein
MPEWQEALHKEVERSHLIQASTGTWCGGQRNISTRENLFRGILDPHTQPRGNFGRLRPRDPDVMDVDRVQVTGLSAWRNMPTSMKKGNASIARNLGTSHEGLLLLLPTTRRKH